METAAEMFGYEQEGGLRIPCEGEKFQKMLRALEGRRKRQKKEKKQDKKDSCKERSFSFKIYS